MEREAAAGITPDPEIDAFMKVRSRTANANSCVLEVLRNVCARRSAAQAGVRNNA